MLGAFFRDRGHEVRFARDLIGAMSPDRLIVFAAETTGLIVVTHDNDFGRFVSMLPAGGRHRFEQGAGCISLRVKETRAVMRLHQEIEAIELLYEQSLKRHRRLLMTITETGFRVITNPGHND